MYIYVHIYINTYNSKSSHLFRKMLHQYNASRMIFKLFDHGDGFDETEQAEGAGASAAMPSLHVRSDDPVAQMRALRMQVGGIRLAARFMTPELQEDFLVTYHCSNSSWDWYILIPCFDLSQCS